LAPEVPQDAQQVAAALAQHGVRVGAVAARRFRLVTHYGIEDRDIEQTVAVFKQVLAK
jgi:threonine aldolase